MVAYQNVTPVYISCVVVAVAEILTFRSIRLETEVWKDSSFKILAEFATNLVKMDSEILVKFCAVLLRVKSLSLINIHS